MTKGEYRVGITFNPSNDDTVSKIKRLSADLIDMIESIGTENIAQGAVVENAEVRRLKALALTSIEEGAMWAVKAATKGPMP